MYRRFSGAERIPYTEASIRNMVSSGELVEGQHYFKRRRRIMFSRQAMREWVEQQSIAETAPLPLVRNRRNGHPVASGWETPEAGRGLGNG
jgi:hypothetical protein